MKKKQSNLLLAPKSIPCPISIEEALAIAKQDPAFFRKEYHNKRPETTQAYQQALVGMRSTN